MLRDVQSRVVTGCYPLRALGITTFQATTVLTACGTTICRSIAADLSR